MNYEKWREDATSWTIPLGVDATLTWNLLQNPIRQQLGHILWELWDEFNNLYGVE